MGEKSEIKRRTLRERGMAMPTMKRKKGMTKSARLQPSHGACPMTGHSPPAPSTSIISCFFLQQPNQSTVIQTHREISDKLHL